jgi:hypothetical protein
MEIYKNSIGHLHSGDFTPNGYFRKRSAGFSVVGLLTLMPLMMTLMLGGYAAILQIKEFSKNKNLCRHLLYYSHDIMSNWLNQLLALNPDAKKLRHKLKAAQIKLQVAIATGNAVRILTCERKIVEIQLEQARLDEKQKKLIQQVKNEQNRIRLNIKLNFENLRVETTIPELQIYADQPLAVAPIYLVPNDFRKLQTGEAKYFIDNHSQLCRASIEPRGLYYRATLVEG